MHFKNKFLKVDTYLRNIFNFIFSSNIFVKLWKHSREVLMHTKYQYNLDIIFLFLLSPLRTAAALVMNTIGVDQVLFV